MNNNVKIKIKNLSFSYQDRSVLENITMEILENSITAVTGPSGQGKSTFLMIFNRLWENVEATKMKGDIKINFGKGFQNIYDSSFPVHELRRQVGMVFQVPNPLPMSIYNNVAFPLKLKGEKNKEYVFPKVKKALKNAFLWKEVKDRLNKDARDLSGGQQQRLCIARALILNPQILLLDEPTSSLDDKSGRVIEDLLLELKKTCTIILVSHYQDQVKRIADTELLLSDGKLL
ncbi:MAG: phosphate ABC transporter ATP-binding protein [Desulfobacteraceae bacterium]|nr:phosphate ABC transporter ATP-binding protein [Desulfobacteraceae bacterium]